MVRGNVAATLYSAFLRSHPARTNKGPDQNVTLIEIQDRLKQATRAAAFELFGGWGKRVSNPRGCELLPSFVGIAFPRSVPRDAPFR